jgi:hypothetical protein
MLALDVVDELAGVAALPPDVGRLACECERVVVEVRDSAMVAHLSKAWAGLIAAWRSAGRCISTSEHIGSSRPAVNKFIWCASKRPSHRQRSWRNCH